MNEQLNICANRRSRKVSPFFCYKAQKMSYIFEGILSLDCDSSFIGMTAKRRKHPLLTTNVIFPIMNMAVTICFRLILY